MKSRQLEQRDSKMSDAPPLEILPTQDKTQHESSQVSANHSCRVSLLFKSSCEYMRQGTLFIGRGALVGNIREGRIGIREGAT